MNDDAKAASQSLDADSTDIERENRQDHPSLKDTDRGAPDLKGWIAVVVSIVALGIGLSNWNQARLDREQPSVPM